MFRFLSTTQAHQLFEDQGEGGEGFEVGGGFDWELLLGVVPAVGKKKHRLNQAHESECWVREARERRGLACVVFLFVSPIYAAVGCVSSLFKRKRCYGASTEEEALKTSRPL